jgi:hypothetical protein
MEYLPSLAFTTEIGVMHCNEDIQGVGTMYIKYMSVDPLCVVGSIRHLMQVQCGVHCVWSTKSTTLTTSGAILCYRTNEITFVGAKETV